MTEQERRYLADRLGEISVMCRMGEITLAQVDERINYLQFLLDHPGWLKDRPVNAEPMMEAAE
jgi:hypothetical protein